MKTLFVVRHAKSSWDNPKLSDIDRPLNKRGYVSALAMGKWLNEFCNQHNINSVKQVVSSANRTRLTAKLIAEAMEDIDVSEEITSDLYLASPNTMLDIIRQQNNDDECVMIVAHNPGSHELVEYFSGKSIKKFATCAVGCFELDIKKWKKADNEHCKTLKITKPSKVLET